MTLRLFEFEDLPWFPSVIREGMTDFLHSVLNTAGLYEPVTGILSEVLAKSNSASVLDLCSGGGGAVQQVQKDLKELYKTNVTFMLSDKFPNLRAYQSLEKRTKGGISFIDLPVDATNVPVNITGCRTIFSGFHHFDRQSAVNVLKSAADAEAGIAIFDGGDKTIFMTLAILLGQPLIFLLFTPFFRPFRFSRLLFTYVLPFIPLCTLWDGIVSILRLYTPAQLLQLAGSVENDRYTWKAGKIKNRFGMNIAYLIGYPVK